VYAQYLTLEYWNSGTLEYWNPGILELWNPGTLEPWNIGTLEHWNIGTQSSSLVTFVTDASVSVFIELSLVSFVLFAFGELGFASALLSCFSLETWFLRLAESQFKNINVLIINHIRLIIW